MLNEIETEIVNKTMKHKKIEAKVDVTKFNTIYFPQGNFTICIVTDGATIVTVGVSKRNPKDHFRPADRAVIGRKRALNEAIKNLFRSKHE